MKFRIHNKFQFFLGFITLPFGILLLIAEPVWGFLILPFSAMSLGLSVELPEKYGVKLENTFEYILNHLDDILYHFLEFFAVIFIFTQGYYFIAALAFFSLMLVHTMRHKPLN